MAVVVEETVERRVAVVGASDGPNTAFGELNVVVEEVEIGLAIDLDVG